MTNEERDLITGLFNRLRSADHPQKDQEAATLIQQAAAAQPSAPYLLVQTVLVQEHALSNAQARIQQLEQQVAAGSSGHGVGGGVGSFLSGLLGGHPSQPASGQPAGRSTGVPPTPAQTYAAPTPPYPSTVNMPPGAGGGFLRSALGTAAGVAGGAMLFEGIQSLLGHNAGPFGGGFGGGGGFFGGGGGFGGGPEIIENREVVNNYYDERGNGNDVAPTEGGGFLGTSTGDQTESDAIQQTDNRYDSGNSGDTDGDGPLYSTPPTDDPVDSGSMDNAYDTDNGDAGGGNDDSSYV